MKVLITGGAGFIGSHLAEELLNRNNDVFIIDDLSTGSIENIEHLKSVRGFNYVIDTIFNEPLLAELIDKCDEIYHLAAAVGVKLIVEKPVKTIETNISGTELVLKNAAKKLKKVLIASSSEVYGKGTKVPFKEDDDMILGPTTKSRWSYACSKAIDEFLALSYWKEMGLPIIVARLFNTIGPRQTGRYGMVVPRFVEQALTNKPITIYGTGKQTRSFCFVKDVIEYLIRLMATKRSYGQVFNVGSDKEISIYGLALKVKQKVNSSAEIKYIPYERVYETGFEDLQRRVPDITRVKKITKYTPRYTLDDAIDSIVADLQKKINTRTIRKITRDK